MAAPKLSEEKKREMWRRLRLGQTKAQIGREMKLSHSCISKYSQEPPPEDPQAPRLRPQPFRDNDPIQPITLPPGEHERLQLPDSWAPEINHVHLDVAGTWGVIGDKHIPFHDRAPIEAFVKECKEEGVVGVLVNGDALDMFGISPFYREPTEERFCDELEMGRVFFAWLRQELPKARIVYREGNHEFRLRRFIVEKAAELYGLPELELPSLLKLANYGIEWVDDKRIVYLGKLPTLHGHELRRGEGVNPARFAFLRTTSPVLVNHFHRTSEHHQRSLDDKSFSTFSVGCACWLHPRYDPYNQWNHGYAFVDVASDGWWGVRNRRLLKGRVV